MVYKTLLIVFEAYLIYKYESLKRGKMSMYIVHVSLLGVGGFL